MQKILTATGLFVGVMGVGMLAGGCERRSDDVYVPSTAPVERPAENPATSIGGGPTSLAINEAVSRIAGARCDHEQRCNNVGAGQRYASPQACLSSVQSDFADDLNARDCPAGIDQRELSECLQEVRNENCGNPLDTLGRLAACRTSDMCRHVP